MSKPIRLVRSCDRRWSDLPGDDARRWCGDCGKVVHDLDALSAAEVEALRRSGDVCATWVPKAPGAAFVPRSVSSTSPRLPAAIAATVALAVLGGCGGGRRSDAPDPAIAEPAAPAEKRCEPTREVTTEEVEQIRHLGYVGE